MTVDREALKREQLAETYIAHGIESVAALIGERDRLRAEARDAEWLRGELVAVRVGTEAERDLLRERIGRAITALDKGGLKSEPENLLRILWPSGEDE